jgi:hypothetical protein
MQKKLAGYFLLTFLSFCFFTSIFHIVGNADAYFREGEVTPQSSVATTMPTPTLFQQQNIVKEQLVLPTPTIFMAPSPLPTSIALPTTVTVRPVVFAPDDLQGFFETYSAQYAVDKELLKRIARCESNFHASSDTGTYAGMFQFSAGTWASARAAMGLDGNPDLRKNAEESIKTAAFMISRGQARAWPNCH